jgi:hypothetical protein
MRSAPPAGWYQDPADPREVRWWDGTQWGPRASWGPSHDTAQAPHPHAYGPEPAGRKQASARTGATRHANGLSRGTKIIGLSAVAAVAAVAIAAGWSLREGGAVAAQPAAATASSSAPAAPASQAARSSQQAPAPPTSQAAPSGQSPSTAPASQPAASQVSKYYSEGYQAGGQSSDGGGDNSTTNTYCYETWNFYDPAPEGLGGQALEDYSSGWTAACEDAPYGQSGVDVPGSGLGPTNPQSPYPPSEGQ